jgi:hypothetical protein
MLIDLPDPQRAAIIAALNAQIVQSVAALQNFQRQIGIEQAAAQANQAAAQPANVVQLRPADGVALNPSTGDGAVAVEVINPSPAPNDPAAA